MPSGSSAPTLSKKRNAFLRPWKNQGFKENSRTKVGWSAIDTSTALASNKSYAPLFPLSTALEEHFFDTVSGTIDAHPFEPRGFARVVGPLIGRFRFFTDGLCHPIGGYRREVIFLHTICGWLGVAPATQLWLLISLRRHLPLGGHHQERLLDGALNISNMGQGLS
jgi:hypothetical protein